MVRWIFVALALACSTAEPAKPQSASAPPSAPVAAPGKPAIRPPAEIPAVADEEAPLPIDLPDAPEVPASAAGAPPPSATRRANTLSLRMLQRVDPQQANLVLAPVSALIALAVLQPAATGTTASELRDALALDTTQVRALTDELATASGTGRTFAQSTVVYLDQALRPRQAFERQLRSSFHAGVHRVPFAQDAGVARTAITQETTSSTSGKVRELVRAGALGPEVQVLLTSAVAWLSPWQVGFDPKLTAPGPFTRRDKRTVQVPFMVREGELSMGMLGEDTTVIELPYAGGQLAMDIVLPSSLDDPASEAFDPDALGRALERLEPARVRLLLPRFRSETSGISLAAFFSAAGARTLFRAEAELPGIAESETPLHVHDLLQSVALEATEKGSEAPRVSPPGEGSTQLPSVQVNRPFLFVVRRPASGLILLVGRIGDPAGASDFAATQ